MARPAQNPRQTTTAPEHLEVRMLYAAVAGVVFDDPNADGVRQATERGAAYRPVFADLNDNGRRDANEPSVRTDARGRYRLTNLPVRKVVVRQLLPDASEQTSPAGVSGAYHVGPPTGAGLKIVVVPGPGLQANRTALASARAAAATWQRFLTDDVTVNVDVELSDIGPPGTLGATTTTHAVLPYDQLRDALVAAASPDEAFVRDLPSAADVRYELSPGGERNPFRFDGRVQVARANLLVLGWSGEALNAPPSAFDPAVPKIDASTSLNTAAGFDYDPADGIGRGKADFFGTVLHEIGHALGFESSVDFVDFYRDNTFVDREVQPTALDLFRLAPGAGAENFPTATRIWAADRDAPAQVFYDGGRYDPTGIFIPGLTRGDVPFSTGVMAGDGQQPSHWKDDRRTRRNLGIFDPTIDVQLKRPAANDLRALDVIGWDVHQPLSGRTLTPATSGTVVGGQDFGVRLGDADDQVSEARPALANAKAKLYDLYRRADVDAFSLRGRQGEKYGIDVDALRRGAVDPFDAYLRVIDSAGRQLAASDNAAAPGERSDGHSPYVELTLPRDGTYFFSVSSNANTAFDPVSGGGDAADATGWSKGYYYLSVVDRSGDGDNRVATAGALPAGGRVAGAIAPADDVDLYKVTAVAGRRFRFDAGVPAGSRCDPLLRLFDAAGGELAWSGGNARSADGATSIEYRFRASGTYYVGVSADGNVAYDPVAGTNRAGGRGGAYTLMAKLFPSIRGSSLVPVIG